MRTHFHLTPSETVQKYLFNSRRPGDSRFQCMHVAEPKNLAEFCNYRDTHEPVLCDHIICRTGNERWQCCVLGEEDPTYKSTIKIVLLVESPDSQVKDLQGATKIYQLCKPCNLRDSKNNIYLNKVCCVFVVGENTHLCHFYVTCHKNCTKTIMTHRRQTTTP